MSADATPITLLYVEDEFLIQEALSTALQEAGFEVLIASNAADAFKLIEKSTDTIRGMITDIKLGKGADGWAVARHAREKIEGLPVVYVSGDSGHEWTSKGVPQSILIGKPFVPAQIVVAISSLLNTSDV